METRTVPQFQWVLVKTGIRLWLVIIFQFAEIPAKVSPVIGCEFHRNVNYLEVIQDISLNSFICPQKAWIVEGGCSRR